MRQFDLSPLYRSTVGFDRLFSLHDQAGSVDNAPSYPPYNIERTGENAYRITVAVAGFSEGELSIESRENTLTIKGAKDVPVEGAQQSETLYRGIAARAFERRFQLADVIKVTGASYENGLLNIELAREVPEHKKPRKVEIDADTTSNPVIEGTRAAA